MSPDPESRRSATPATIRESEVAASTLKTPASALGCATAPDVFGPVTAARVPPRVPDQHERMFIVLKME